jgi:Beta-propeller repeat
MNTRKHAVTFLRRFTLALSLTLTPAATLWADMQKVAPPTPSKATVQSAYGQLPISFEATQGQTNSQMNYLARGHGYQLLVTPSEILLSLHPTVPHSSANPSASPLNGDGRNVETILRLQLLGANHTSAFRGLDELLGKINYFTGADPKNWRTNIPTFAKVIQPQAYPGIDVVYYGNQQHIEFDFVVAPGADPQAIRLKVDGTDRLEIDAQGDLLLHVNSGEIKLQRPHIYQEIAGMRRELSGHYVLNAAQEVSFLVGDYDESRSLVIDPVLVYSTYLGGNDDDQAMDIAVDSLGYAYVTGWTGTDIPNFPTTPGAFQTTASPYSQESSFVTKLNTTGSALVYSTYLSGSYNFIRSSSIAVDADGQAYVTGTTNTDNFPTTPGAFQPTFNGSGRLAFVTALNPTGTALLYSTYLGRLSQSGSQEQGSGIAVDALGHAYVTGTTGSPDFPTTPGAFQTTLGGGNDAFVTVLNPIGTGLVYSTYLGGSTPDYSSGIAVDVLGNAYVTGDTYPGFDGMGNPPSPPDFPTTPGAFQTTPHGVTYEAFVTKLNPTGSGLVYSTYLGGNDGDFSYGIAVDASGSAYVTGSTMSTDFPTTPGAFQTTLSGGSVFVTKLNPTGSSLVYSTYLNNGYGGFAVDGSGHAYVIGNFATTCVGKLNPTGTALVYSAYPGPCGQGAGIAVDADGQAYVTGSTRASDFFPTTPGAFQTTPAGGSDAFVMKMTFSANNSPVCSAAVANPASIWAPNHQFIPIVITGVTDSNGDSVTIAVTGVTQDEQVNAQGSGMKSPDAVIQAGAASVRAERSGNGNGRVYHIAFTAEDGNGGACAGLVKVGVPHSMGKGLIAIDDGQLYNSTIP